jgi:hypothetical protein
MRIATSFVETKSILEIVDLPKGTEIYTALAVWEGDEQFVYAVGVDCYVIMSGALVYLKPTDEPLLKPFLNEHRFWIETKEIDDYLLLIQEYLSEEDYQKLQSGNAGDIVGAILGVTFHMNPNHFKIKGL